jgi:hypothetical protein
VAVSSTQTIKAIAYKAGMTDSAVASATYIINLPVVSAPTFSPAAATYTATQTVTISSTTSGASIRYTTDGSTPSDTAGTVYSGPVTVSATTSFKAIAYKTGMMNSTVATATYTITGTVAPPTFTPGAGTYTTAQTVALATTTSGASIRYTIDGSTPSSTVGTVYSAPIAGMQVVALLTTAPAHHLKHRPFIRDFRDVRIQPNSECIKLELEAAT